MYDNTSRVIEVNIDEILPNRFQPRIQFDENEILELSDSIKEHGVIQPIVVRTIGDKYEIIAGERRYKASVLAGKETVPVIVKNLNDKDSAEVALIENVQRKNLTPIEEALSYKKILDMGYTTQESLAEKLGKSQSSIANKIRLLNLSDEVQDALLENKISERHARSLLRLDTAKLQNEMLQRIINERLTVRRTDEEIEKIKNQDSTSEDDDSQKVMRKGEIDMDNNMFGIPNVPQNQSQQPSFDIFGSENPQPQAEQPAPTMPSFDVASTPSTPEPAPAMPSFDIFGTTSTPEPRPAMPSFDIPSTPSIPEPAPTMSSFDIPSTPSTPEPAPTMPSFDIPSTPSTPAPAPTMPSFDVASTPSTPEPAPTMPSFDIASTPSTPAMPEFSLPSMQPIANEVQTANQPSVPVTSPIIESSNQTQDQQMTQESENLFSFGTNEPETTVSQATQSQPEFKMPEPIIVTDYSKQYDPVMPQTVEQVTPKVEFKEVINAIRECSSKIEQYGFKIDVEEYDLANLYQVIFKIEK